MFPDSPYAGATGTFKRPVLPPTVDPDGSPNRTFTIACEWLPYIRGSLQQLLLQSTWDVPDQASLILAQARAQTLISMFTECSEVRLPFACPYDFQFETSPSFDQIDYTPYSPNLMGHEDLGVGWLSTTSVDSGSGTHLNAIALVKTYATAFTCSDIVVKGQYGHGTFTSPYYSLDIEAFHGATLQGQMILSDTDLPDGNFDRFLLLDDVLVDKIIVQLFCSKWVGSGTDGFGKITRCDVSGLEPSPC